MTSAPGNRGLCAADIFSVAAKVVSDGKRGLPTATTDVKYPAFIRHSTKQSQVDTKLCARGFEAVPWPDIPSQVEWGRSRFPLAMDRDGQAD